MKLKIADVMRYFADHSSDFRSLPRRHRAQWCYLADWKHALDYGKQITDTEWTLGKAYHGFLALTTPAVYNKPTSDHRMTLSHVIVTMEPMKAFRYYSFINSTYPISKSCGNRETVLDLLKEAKEYKRK